MIYKLYFNIMHISLRLLRQAKSCYVYKTKTTNPFKNLAFEDWMYKNVNFSKRHCLFLWQNRPTMVIGKFQNPWKECRVEKLKENNVNLCRRSSGGGTVYHDMGNLNITFFTDKQSYDRKHNLNVIVEALKQKWPTLDIEINKRDDIILNKKHKISGTSSKLGRECAYHHCTLLVNSDKRDIFEYINRENIDDLSCKATNSVVSPVANLSDAICDVTVEEVVDCISSNYSQLHSESQVFEIETGDEKLLPGVSELQENHLDWDWVYGRTPKFDLSVKVPSETSEDLSVSFEIKKGIISSINHKSVLILNSTMCSLEKHLLGNCFDRTFLEQKLKLLEQSSMPYTICQQLINYIK